MRFVTFAVVVLSFTGCMDRGTTGGSGTTTTTTAASKKVYSREEFKAAVMGKTPEEVIAAVGKPDSTTESSNGQAWYYRSATNDPVTGKIDFSVQVIFTDGRVSRVNY